MSVRLDGRSVESNASLVALYQDRIRRSGMSAETMFYQASEQHALKLRTYAKECLELDPGESVLDVGCGYGALLDYLHPGCDYRGIDIVPEFIAEARMRYPRADLCLADLLIDSVELSDWVVLAGVLSSVPEPAILLRAATAVCRKGLWFDMTIRDRLSPSFDGLNRWTVDAVESAIAEAKLRSLRVIDEGHSWLLFKCTRS